MRLRPSASRVFLFAAVALVVATRDSRAQATPVSLTADGKVNPRQMTNILPSFAWSHPGQYSYEIQVNNTNDAWEGGNYCAWFWDSGEIVSTAQSKAFPGGEYDNCTPQPGQGKQAIHRSPIRVWWRIRVRDVAGGPWSAWALSWLEMNQYPNEPKAITAAAGTGGGANVIGTRVSGTSRNVGTGQTYATIASAMSAAACGDTVLVHAGTYAEPVSVTNKSCSWNNPLTIKANPGDTVVLNYVAGSPIYAASSSHVSIEGFKVTGSGGRYGAQILDTATYLRLYNLNFDDSFSSGGNSVMYFRGSYGIVENCRIFTGVSDAYAGFESTTGQSLTLRGNDFSGHITRSIAISGDRDRSGHMIANNYFHDITAYGPVILDFYYGSQAMRVDRNVIVAPPTATVFRLQRAGNVSVTNNLVKGGTTGFDDYDSGGHYDVRNNVFMGVGTVYGSTSSGNYPYTGPHCKNYKDDGLPQPTTAWTVDYNAYFNCGTIEQSDLATCLIRGTNECNGGSACDPKLDSNGNGVFDETTDFHPTAGSAALIDKASPGTPIPAGGGPTADIGRFEYRAGQIATTGSYPYDQKYTIPSLTPRIAWGYSSIINNRTGAQTSNQGAYIVKIDTVPTFDSQGPHRPLINSGRISSSSGQYDVPSGKLQDKTTYYVAITTGDNVESSEDGMWSPVGWAIATDLAGGTNPTPPGTPPNLRRVDKH